MIPLRPVNVDVNLAPKFFKGAKEVYVTSMFYTIQGEGPFAGVPAVFLRLAGCNFGGKSLDGFCPFCDTSFQIEGAQRYTPSELAQELAALGTPKTSLLVITGGEPMLQPLVLDALDVLYSTDRFSDFQFETNGTQESFMELLQYRHFNMSTMVVVSPKANFITKKYAPLKDEVQRRLDALKFVLSADPESPHHEIPEWAFDLGKERGVSLFVSPMAVYKRAPDGEISSAWDSTLVDHEATARNYQYAAQFAMQNNVELSIQSHLFTAIP